MAAIWFHDQIDGPSVILDKKLLLGNINDSRDKEKLMAHNVGCVISLLSDEDREYEDVELYKRLGIDWFHFQLDDDASAPISNYLEAVNQLIKQFTRPHRQRPVVLVHCQAGISRSSTMVIYHLMQSHGYTLQDALSHVKRCRHIIEPREEFINALHDADLSQRYKSLYK